MRKNAVKQALIDALKDEITIALQDSPVQTVQQALHSLAQRLNAYENGRNTFNDLDSAYELLSMVSANGYAKIGQLLTKLEAFDE